MTKKQTLKDLAFINRHLVLASARMHKISEKIGIAENEDIKKVIEQVEELIRLGEER